MTHSNTDNTLSLNADISAAPDSVNRTPLATPRCPIPQELDYRGAIVPSRVPSRTMQTAPTKLLSFDGPRTENSKDHAPSRPCLSIPPDLISEALGYTQPLSRRAPRYIRRNTRRAADDEFPFSAADSSKTILHTVAASIYSVHDFPAQMQVTKPENEYENNRCSFDPVLNSHTPRESPAPPSHPRANHRRTMNTKPFPAKNPTIAALAAPPTSPLSHFSSARPPTPESTAPGTSAPAPRHPPLWSLHRRTCVRSPPSGTPLPPISNGRCRRSPSMTWNKASRTRRQRRWQEKPS